MNFVVSYSFLSVLELSFCIGTENVMRFSVQSPKQVNCYSNFSENSFMIKS